jgi:hypothetical protein
MLAGGSRSPRQTVMLAAFSGSGVASPGRPTDSFLPALASQRATFHAVIVVDVGVGVAYRLSAVEDPGPESWVALPLVCRRHTNPAHGCAHFLGAIGPAHYHHPPSLFAAFCVSYNGWRFFWFLSGYGDDEE